MRRHLWILEPLATLSLVLWLGYLVIDRRQTMREWLLTSGALGPLLSVGIYTALASAPFISAGALALLNGAIFGVWEGAAINCVAVVLSGLSTYALARSAGARLHLHEELERLPAWAGRLPVGSPLFLIALRLIPWMGGTIANNVTAFYHGSMWRHMWTRVVVAVPIAIFNAYLGSKLAGLVR